MTLFILHVGWEVTGELLHHLMDGVDEDRATAAAAAAATVPGVHEVTVRGRWTGRSLIFDVAGRLDPAITVRASDRIGDAVRSAVFAAVDDARHVSWTPRSG